MVQNVKFSPNYYTITEFNYVIKNNLENLKNFSDYCNFIKRCSKEQKIKTYDIVINSFVNNNYDIRSLEFIFELYAGKSRKRLIIFLEQRYMPSLMMAIKKKLVKVINRNDDLLITLYYENAENMSSENIYFNYIPEGVNNSQKIKEIHEKYDAQFIDNKMLVEYYLQKDNMQDLIVNLLDRIEILEEELDTLKNFIKRKTSLKNSFNNNDDGYGFNDDDCGYNDDNNGYTQEQLDDYANQNNPNNDAYQANHDNHANQCNPNNDEYRGK